MKPRRKSDLERWMDDHKWSDAKFAAAVSAEMIAITPLRAARVKPVSPSTVTKWRLGSSLPRRDAIIAIENLTGGEVTAAGLVHAERPS